ncbi:MAG: hypothetical protein IAG10_22900, partial [Planctomycetaceae bacterium]|nr:hypothetical protein [Planctomycetaceae bacterium]
SPDSGLKFKLNVAPDDKPVASKGRATVGDKPAGGRGLPGNQKGVTEVDRANRRKQAVDQLGDLNKVVENEKLAQQQVQQPQAQQPANPQPQNRQPNAADFNAPAQQNGAGPGVVGGKIFGDGSRADQSGKTLSEMIDRGRGRYGVAQGGGSFGGSGGGGGFGGGGIGGGGQGGYFGSPRRGSGPVSGTPQSSLGVGVKSNSGVVGSVILDEPAQQIYMQERISDAEAEERLRANLAWTQAGGLSLPIDIQREGNVLRFSRASGSPRLALSVRPNESDKLGLGLVWAAIWVSIAVWLLRLIAGSSSGSTCQQAIAGLSALGLLGMFFLPSPLSELCFLAFALSAIVLAIGVMRRRRQNAAA